MVTLFHSLSFPMKDEDEASFCGFSLKPNDYMWKQKACLSILKYIMYIWICTPSLQWHSKEKGLRSRMKPMARGADTEYSDWWKGLVEKIINEDHI